MFHIFCDFFFSRGVKFRPLFFRKGEKTARERERERKTRGKVRASFFSFSERKLLFYFLFV